MPLRARPAVLTALALLVLPLAAVPATAQDESDLARARDQIAAVEDDIDAAVDARQGAQLRLDDAREALDRVEAVVNAVAQRVADQQDHVDEARDELDGLAEQEEAVRAAIRAKAIELYKRGAGSEFTSLIDARDIQSAMDRSAFIRLVAAHDQASVEDLDASMRRIRAARGVLRREQDLLDDLLADQQQVMADAEEVRDSRALAAAAAADEVDHLESEHDDLQDLEAEIERAIAEREAAEEAARRAAEETARRAAEEAAAREAAEQAAAAEAAAAAASSDEDTGDADDGAAGASDDEDDGASDDEDDGESDDPDPPPPTSGGGYAWPLCGPVTSEFGWRWGRPHEGMDIDDTYTQNITAAQSGTVISAGFNSGGYGNLVLIQHPDGVVTAYAHASAIHVSSGQSVSRGQSIATVGSTGNSTGPHLHFETRVGGSDPVDPRQFLSGGGC